MRSCEREQRPGLRVLLTHVPVVGRAARAQRPGGDADWLHLGTSARARYASDTGGCTAVYRALPPSAATGTRRGGRRAMRPGPEDGMKPNVCTVGARLYDLRLGLELISGRPRSPDLVRPAAGWVAGGATASREVSSGRDPRGRRRHRRRGSRGPRPGAGRGGSSGTPCSRSSCRGPPCPDSCCR